MNSSGKKLIIVAEDDDSIRTLLQCALSAQYEVEVFHDGASAMLRLESGQPPDLLVFDVMMPGVDGLSLARRVKADPQLRQIPIIFLTARSTPKDVILGIQAGARHYVTKPFKLADLLAKIRGVLGS
ncbi:MAG: response regulator [Polyangiaceae bacterium]|jgi:DNA-binding response OmpR family regulator|nr:response regulator [Polyangiaceae bacterium]